MLLAISTELVLLYGSILAIIGLFLSKAGFRFGVPTLLLFLGVGMLASSTGFVEFNAPEVAQSIGIVALTVILFSGGMDTSIKEIKPVATAGALLATVGVLLTAFITGTFIFYLCKWINGPVQLSYLESLLLASVMSSTDSASVFSILRSKKINLKYNLKPLLEFESGSNDPMAYMLTVILIQLIQAEGSIGVWEALGMFAMQFVLGVVLGVVLGKLAVWLVNRFNLQANSLYPVLVLMIAFFIFSFTTLVYGNGYLAVYIGGLVIGNSKMVSKVTVAKFFDGFQWLCQLIMFLALGMLVNVDSLVQFALPALIISVFLMLFGRPISVHLTLLPFWKQFNMKAQSYISWVGLRGAVPIIFAISPWVAGIESAEVIFTVVFFVTLVSLTIQGSSVSLVAEKLNLIDTTQREKKFEDVNLPEHIKTALSEIIVTKEMIAENNTLANLNIPEESLAILIERGTKHFIPRGNTELMVDDHVLLISTDEQALVEAYEELGVSTYSIEKNL